MALHYAQAAHVLDQLEARRGGIKTLVFQSDFANKKLVYAMVAETLKYAGVIETLLRDLYARGNAHSDRHWNDDEATRGIFDADNKWIVRAMVHDLLFGARKTIQSGGGGGGGRGGDLGALKLSLTRERAGLEVLLAKRMTSAGVKTRKELIPERLRGGKHGGAGLPRYARVNTLKMTTQDVQGAFDPVKRALAKAERKRLWHEANGGAAATAAAAAGATPASPGKPAKKERAKNKTKIDALAVDKIKALQSNPATAKPSLDPHVRNLLRFPAGRDLHNHPLVENGALILQDKSSCFSAQVLADSLLSETRPERRDFARMDMIDACAAPGNKTSHLASLVALMCGQTSSSSSSSSSSATNASASASATDPNLPTIFAFDKSPPRLGVLQRRMKEAGADHIVQSNLQSFLEVDPADPKYARITAVLLDPSCSGSGMASRLDHFIDTALGRGTGSGRGSGGSGSGGGADAEAQRRLKSLSDFQKEALLHAFSFPNVRHVVYSTCSVHNEENEHVVAHVLDCEGAQPSSKGFGPFRLAKALPHWPRRGRPGQHQFPPMEEEEEEEEGASSSAALPLPCRLTQAEADCLVRVLPDEDETNGFFVALFQRGVVTAGTVQNANERQRKKKRNAKRKEREKRAKRRKKEEQQQQQQQQKKKK
jgi:putative methyltransferase